MKLLISTSAPTEAKQPNLKSVLRLVRTTAFKANSTIENTDSGLLVVVAQTLVALSDKQVIALAKEVLRDIGASSIKSYKAGSNGSARFTALIDGAKYYIGDYTSYDGANDGAIGGICISASSF